MTPLELPAKWEAVDTATDEVLGAWHENLFSPAEIRGLCSAWYPGTRLRVTRYTTTTTWDDDEEQP